MEWPTMSTAFDRIPPAPATRFAAVGSSKMFGIRRWKYVQLWLRWPVLFASWTEKLVEVMFNGSKIRSLTNSWYVFPEYVEIISVLKIYIYLRGIIN